MKLRSRVRDRHGRSRLLRLFGHLAMGGLVSTAAIAAGRLPVPADLLELRRPSDPRLSPDGSWVAYVAAPPAEAEETAPEIWLISIRDGEERRVTRNPGADLAPRWSADGEALFFISRPPEGAVSTIALYRLAERTHRPVPGAEGARDLELSPAGERIAFLKRDPVDPEVEARRQRGDDARVVGRDPEHTRLFVIAAGGGEARPLGSREATVWHYGWAPDGSAIAALASRSPIAEGHEYGSRLVLYDVASGEERLLAERTNPQANPAFSADGEWIAYLGPVGEFKERGIPHVVRRRGGEPRPLLRHHPGNVWDLAWHPHEPHLLAAIAEGVEHHLASVDLDGALRRLVPMHHSIIPYWDRAWDVSADGRRAVFVSEEGGGAEELWLADFESKKRRQLTRLNPQLAQLELGQVDAVRFTNPADGANVEAVLVRPPPSALSGSNGAARAEDGRLPLVVWLHGGPAYNWGLGGQLRSWAQLFAARGYLVLLPNFRGSSGYGMDWMMANVRNWGDGPLGDLLAGVDHLIASGDADPDRLFVGGGSYGGYLTYWTIAHSQHFRAAFVRAGVADLTSEYALTDEPSFLVGYFNRTPYDDPEIYRRSSPLTHARRVRTPLLMVHGERDLRVPLSQSLQLRSALEHYGATVELVVYPREGHGIREPAHRLDVIERALAWFERWRR